MEPRRHQAHDVLGYDPQISVEGNGIPLIFVPGMDGTGQLFYRQIPLLNRTYRVATYRLRDAAANMGVLVDDLAHLTRAVSVSGDPVMLVGESFGGALALSFALARPHNVAGLVILNSFPRFLPQVRLRLAILGLRVMPWRAMSIVRRFTGFRLHSSYTHRAEIQRFLELTAETTRLGYLNRLRILKDYDVRDQLADIRAPTLLLAADRDHLVPSVQQANYMMARIPHATLRVLHGHGHICLIAPNVDLNEILHDWRSTP